MISSSPVYSLQVRDKAACLSQQFTIAPSSSLTNGELSKEPVTDAAIRQRIDLHSNDLQDYYFSIRSKAMIGDASDDGSLDDFTSGQCLL